MAEIHRKRIMIEYKKKVVSCLFLFRMVCISPRSFCNAKYFVGSFYFLFYMFVFSSSCCFFVLRPFFGIMDSFPFSTLEFFVKGSISHIFIFFIIVVQSSHSRVSFLFSFLWLFHTMLLPLMVLMVEVRIYEKLTKLERKSVESLWKNQFFIKN